MKTTTVFKMTVLFLIVISVVSCKGNKSGLNNRESDTVMVAKDSIPFVLKHLDVDKKKVMAYVTCSEHTVDSLLSIADTAYSKTGSYSLEDLGMDNEEYNKWITKDYKDTISIVIALFYSYASMVNSGMDEASASFVWHEVARLQMKHFYEKTDGEWQEPNSYEKLFRVIDGIMGTYGCGTQTDMNMAAWRSVMPVDYRLIEAYKQLAGLCNDRSMVKLIHDDYMFTLTTYREHREGIDEWYSDLPREQGVLFNWLLKVKLNNIRRLVNGYQKGKIGIEAVKKNLMEHMCIADNKSKRLSEELLDKTIDEF